MATRALFRDDAYWRECEARVTGVHEAGRDLQPCGGSHVANLAKIEKNSAKTRRVTIEFA